MEADFRWSMTWLHTWAGVVLGAILFAIFWMGTLSVFDKEIDQWMKPQTRLPVPEKPFSFDSLRPVLDAAIAQNAPSWYVGAPTDREPVVRVGYAAGTTYVSHDLYPATGRVLPEAETRAASGFLYPFHYSLQLRVLNLGVWLVGLASMAMLVLCVSGVVIHRKIFTDFFTFRPGKKPLRVVLDLHNLSGLLGLPFHMAITFSGLVIFGGIYFPAGVQAVYSDRGAYVRDIYGGFPPEKPGARGVSVASLDLMVAQARALWGDNASLSLFVSNPGTTTGRVRVLRSDARQVRLESESFLFEAMTGRLIVHQHLQRPVLAVQQFLAGLHLVRFHHWILRWVYFLLGLSSCVMIATGFFFWLEARRKKQGSAVGFRFVEGMTVGSVTGIILATLTFFIANRLLPSGAHFMGQDRATLEVWAFYLVWIASFAHAWLRPSRAWGEQSAAIATFAVVAVALNWVTTGDHLLRTLTHRWLWPVAGMDMVLLVGAALAGLMAVRLVRQTDLHPTKERV